MDLEKLLDFASEYLSEYAAIFVATATHPSVRFSPAIEDARGGEIVLPAGLQQAAGSRLSPKLFTFVVISIFLGVTISGLIPGRRQGPDLAASTIVVLISWFVFSTIAHWVSRMLGGRGAYSETLSVSLQLLSVIYVISCFLALVVGAAAQLEIIQELARTAGDPFEFLVRQPVSTYFVSQTVLMLIYLLWYCATFTVSDGFAS
jgi:Yip1-like protein